jgi:F-type H+-transporting ATPase subunit delta
MKGAKAASRYAKSLLSLAVEQKVLDTAYSDMKLIDDTCDQNRELQALLKSPVIKGDKKQAVMNAVFGAKLSPITAGFIKLIIQHRREDMLHEIADSFVKQYKAHKNIGVAEVITAAPLKADAKNKLMEVLRKQEGREMEIVEKVDPSLIGGLIVRIGDKQFDGSISRKLNDLKKDFSKNPYVPSL